MNFTLSSILTIISIKNYQKLIIDNNQFYDMLATIPLGDFPAELLDLTIHVKDASNLHKHLAICSILQSLPWCHHIKATQTEGKILFVTTKNQLTNAHQWLDSNLEPLFKNHLLKNLQYQALSNKTIPWCLDCIATTGAALMYLPSNSDDAKKKFAKTPNCPTIKPINSYMTVNNSLLWLITTPTPRILQRWLKVTSPPQKCPQLPQTRLLWLLLPIRWQCKTLRT